MRCWKAKRKYWGLAEWVDTCRQRGRTRRGQERETLPSLPMHREVDSGAVRRAGGQERAPSHLSHSRDVPRATSAEAVWPHFLSQKLTQVNLEILLHSSCTRMLKAIAAFLPFLSEGSFLRLQYVSRGWVPVLCHLPLGESERASFGMRGRRKSCWRR